MKNYILVGALAAVLGAAASKYFWPTVAYKEVEVEKLVTKTDIRTITRTVERPDGTKETTIESTDKSVAKQDSKKSVEIRTETNWILGVTATAKLDDLRPSYGVQVQRRIIGPVFVGLSATDKAYFGLVVSLEF